MKEVNTLTLFFFIVLSSVNGLNPNSEEDIENFIERKVAEVYENKIKDLEIKSVLQDRILKEYERKFKTQNEILREHAKLSKRLSAEGVAFSTQLTVSQRHIGLRQTIKFDRVDLNDGNGYSEHTGAFTAPQSGVYMFAYFLGHGSESAQVWLELMHNGNKINGAVADTFHQYQDTQGGNFAIVRLNAGDSVWVESWHVNDSYLDPLGFTTFSGALLY